MTLLLNDETGEVVGHILYTPMEEVWREDWKERWCFTCRKRLTFEYVVSIPICITGDETGCWYGPTNSIECPNCHRTDADCFPGTSREWSDE